MKFTPGYSRVALFNTPVRSIGPQTDTPASEDDTHSVTQVFRVGSFDYKIYFYGIGSGMYDVSFELWKINLRGQELADTVNKILKPRVPFTIDKAEALNSRPRLGGDPKTFDVLGIGNAPQVLGNAFAIAANFVQKYRPHGLEFSANTETKQSRASVYEAMLKRFFPQAEIKKRFDKGWTVFQVIFPGHDTGDA